MSTSVTSVTNHFPSAEDGFTTTLASTVSSGATTVPLNSVAGYTNGEIAVFVVDPSNASKKQAFTGIVDTSGVQLTSVKWTSGTNQDHTAGSTVVDYATATHISMMSKGILVEHTQAGRHNMTSPQVITGINDTNGNELLKVTATGSAVNEVTLANAATGNAPSLSATGGDTNIGLALSSKGTSGVTINGAKPWLFLGSASAVADQGSITTIVDLTSLSVTVTVPTGATTVRITSFVKAGNTTVDNINFVYIFEGATQLSADPLLSRSNASTGAVTHKPVYIGTATAGSHTYKLRADNGGAGTMTARASATAPNYIIVECC